MLLIQARTPYPEHPNKAQCFLSKFRASALHQLSIGAEYGC